MQENNLFPFTPKQQPKLATRDMLPAQFTDITSTLEQPGENISRTLAEHQRSSLNPQEEVAAELRTGGTIVQLTPKYNSEDEPQTKYHNNAIQGNAPILDKPQEIKPEGSIATRTKFWRAA